MEMLSKRTMTLNIRLSLLLPAALLIGGFATGCASDTSYDRHNKSRLWITQDGKQLYFDASVSAQYPADTEAAEAARLGWLADWIKLRKYCTDGYNVTERRAIRAEEYNPQRHDLRYSVECT